MGSDPQSYLQAMHDAEHRECDRRIAELERERDALVGRSDD